MEKAHTVLEETQKFSVEELKGLQMFKRVNNLSEIRECATKLYKDTPYYNRETKHLVQDLLMLMPDCSMMDAKKEIARLELEEAIYEADDVEDLKHILLKELCK